ncbi:hypothetical protein B1218_37350, partial [Pseudomonas ogarae]
MEICGEGGEGKAEGDQQGGGGRVRSVDGKGMQRKGVGGAVVRGEPTAGKFFVEGVGVQAGQDRVAGAV